MFISKIAGTDSWSSSYFSTDSLLPKKIKGTSISFTKASYITFWIPWQSIFKQMSLPRLQTDKESSKFCNQIVTTCFSPGKIRYCEEVSWKLILCDYLNRLSLIKAAKPFKKPSQVRRSRTLSRRLCWAGNYFMERNTIVLSSELSLNFVF